MKNVPYPAKGLLCISGLALACWMAPGVESRTVVQQGQGKYLTQASAALEKLMDDAAGYKLLNNALSIGGGWMTQGADNWVSVFTIKLEEGKDYRFLAAGDKDTVDLDLKIQDSEGRVVAADEGTEPTAVVSFRPTARGDYLVRLRLYASQNNLPCTCLAAVLAK
jgi:hypothetical protein